MKLLFILAKQAGVNLTELANKVAHALCQKFMMANGYDSLYYWPEEVWDDFVIAKSRVDGKLYKLNYTVTDGEVSFSEPVQVEETYVEVASTQCLTIDPPSESLRAPVAASVATQSHAVYTQISGAVETESKVRIAFQAKQKLDATGFKWLCQIVGFGMSKTRDIWESEIFRQSLQLWEGIDCYADHSSQSEMVDRPERSIHDKVGVWQGFVVTEQGVDAVLHIKPSAGWFAEDLLWAEQNGFLHFYGFSLVALTRAKQVQAPDGQPARLHTQIVRPLSVDAVTMDAANGHIKAVLQSRRSQETNTMKPNLLARLFRSQPSHFKIVRQGLIGAGAAGITAEMNEDVLAQKICENPVFITQCETLLAAADGAIEIVRQTTPQTPATQNDSGQVATQAQTAAPTTLTTEQLPVELREMLIAQVYQMSNLPEATKQSIRGRLGATATIEQHRGAITDAEGILASVAQTDTSFGFNNPRVSVSAETRDKLNIAIARTFELSYDDFNGIESSVGRSIRQSGGQPYKAEQALFNSIQPIESLREFYITATGDRDLVGLRNLPTAIRRQANYTSADFPDLFLDAMHKRLLRDYRAANYMWERVVTVKPVRDFQQQHAILLGYFGDLPTVAEEGQYTTPSALTDTKETYAISKRGRKVALTLEAIANDDLSAFTKTVNRLGRAAARTLAKFIFRTCIMNNPTMAADGLALFHASHGNLLTDPLAATAIKAALLLLQNQTEPGSGERFGMDTRSINLWTPTSLSLDGRSLTEAQNEPGGNTDPLAKTIRSLGISSLTQPVFEDSNDWLLTASTEELDMVEIGFFNGQREPEMFVQNDSGQGDFFEKDIVVQWKIRHIYGGVPVDHRGMVKSSVVGS